jgi:uncharacterized protein (UPF0276 family)
MPEHFFAAPGDLDALAERYPLVFHSVSLSLGTAYPGGRPDRAAFAREERIRALVERARPRWVSDHLAITRSPAGVDLGHLCPVPCTRAAVRVLTERVARLQDSFGVPLAIENIAHPFRLEGSERSERGLTEAELLSEVVATTGCKVLLDLTNLVYDARNFGLDAPTELGKLPLGAVVAVHLAGGARGGDGFWADTHAEPVEPEALALLPLVARAAPLEAIVIERDAHLPGLAELCAEARRAVSLASGV